MKSRIWVLFVVLAGLCWGVYIPLVAGGGKMIFPPPPSSINSYASILCVGAAYFLIAILFPVAILLIRRRKPDWSVKGVTYATLAGAAGALGALCVVFATIEFKGPRIYVAPIIFSLAPVINTLVSLFWHPDEGAFRVGLPREKPHWSLYIGILCAGAGAFFVLLAKELSETKSAEVKDYTFLVFVVLAGLCWGTYVPLIAQGGKELKNSYASFLCVGVAYFLLAILLPVGILWNHMGRMDLKAPDMQSVGVTLATLAGAAGAVGALCVIFATFEFKGPKIYVAPVIFALAPVINTLVSLFWQPTLSAPWTVDYPKEAPHDWAAWALYSGIVLAGAGAGLVLFAKELTEMRHARAKPAGAPLPAAASEAVKP
jgi:drug/metabolite transporter (DMT)-like permease